MEEKFEDPIHNKKSSNESIERAIDFNYVNSIILQISKEQRRFVKVLRVFARVVDSYSDSVKS